MIAERVAQWRGRLHSRRQPSATPYEVPLPDVIWALGSFCALHQRAFDAQLLVRELPAPPLTTDALIAAARRLNFRIQRDELTCSQLARLPLPCLVVLREEGTPRLALIGRIEATQVILFRAGTNQTVAISKDVFAQAFSGTVFQLAARAEPPNDPDGL